jgi:predicted flavoprotein YhiN
VGTSGRVFPKDMKAAPLLRAWLHRLRHPDTGEGVQFHMRHRWLGWMPDGKTLRFASPEGEVAVPCDALVLALGGGSWARLGSDGAWVPVLQARGVAIAPLLPANCGFDVARPLAAQRAQDAETTGAKEATGGPPRSGWSPYFAERFAGQPFKSVAITFTTAQGVRFERKGEFVATATGVEGSLVYAASSGLRDAIARQGHADFTLNLRPDLSPERVLAEVMHPRGSRSFSSHLKSRLGLEGIKMAVLHEVLTKDQLQNPQLLAQTIQAVPLRVVAARPLDEAISTAGGVRFEALTPQLMIQDLPGVFCAGEMLDWEAPTGGYLLTACFASGRRAGLGALAHVLQNH